MHDASSNASDGRLSLPDSVTPGKIDWVYLVPIVVIHALALLVFVPAFFSWTGVAVMLASVFVFGQGITLCYHRLLTHRCAKVPKWFERCLVIVALCSLEDTPGRWVATHRFHHAHSDENPDPHSPLVNFLWAHVGWLFIYNPATHNIGTYQKYARDVLEDPFYLKLEKSTIWVWIYVAHAAIYFAVGLIQSVELGLSLLVWGVFVRTVVVWHITWSVNSFTHMFGYANYGAGDHSRNNWLVALLASGEGWHNNHHHDPASASNQHRWWEIDVTYYLILGLGAIGLATDITPPRHKRIALSMELKQPIDASLGVAVAAVLEPHAVAAAASEESAIA